MEVNVAYLLQNPEEAWREVKQVLKPDSVHVACYKATGQGYNDKKTMLNVSSRLSRVRSSFFVVCSLEQVSDIISYAEEICNLDTDLKYNVVAEHCNRISRMRFVVEIGPGLLNHQCHSVRTYRTLDELNQGFKDLFINSSIRQQLCVLVGNETFFDLVDSVKDQARYVVAFTSDNTQVVTKCRQKAVTARSRQ